jgi:hypothetical protein
MSMSKTQMDAIFFLYQLPKNVAIFMTLLSTLDFVNIFAKVEKKAKIFHNFTMHTLSSDTINMKKKLFA